MYNNIVTDKLFNNKFIKNKYDIKIIDKVIYTSKKKLNNSSILISTDGLSQKEYILPKNNKSLFLCDCCNNIFNKDMFISWKYKKTFFKSCLHCFFIFNTDIELVDGTLFSNGITIYDYILKCSKDHKVNKCKNKYFNLSNYKKKNIIYSNKFFFEINKEIIKNKLFKEIYINIDTYLKNIKKLYIYI